VIHLPLSGLWHALSTCAKIVLSSAVNPVLNHLFPRHRSKQIKHISDHLARDIGIGPTEMERHRHVWPSQSVDRPRI
jgi:hypothetical protein